MPWICRNDRYCAEANVFEDVEDFEKMVRECFPDDCDGWAIRPAIDRDGVDIYLDEDDEVALRWIEHDDST